MVDENVSGEQASGDAPEVKNEQVNETAQNVENVEKDTCINVENIENEPCRKTICVIL